MITRKIPPLIWTFLFIIFGLLQLSCNAPPWSNEDQIPILPIGDIFFLNKDEFWLITGKGKLFHITNNGQMQKEVKFDVPVTQIFFLNDNEGWGLTRDGLLLATTDGGKTWIKKNQVDNKTNTAPRSANQLIFSDNQIGWIVQGLGFWLTEDGGSSWTQLLTEKEFSIGEGGQPSTYFPLNSKIGWLGMSNGIILKTTNSGKSWENVSLPKPPYDSSLNRQPGFDVESLYCFDEKYCLASIASRGGLFVTKNGGDWEAILENKVKPGTNIKSIDFATRKIGWAVGKEYTKDLLETPGNIVLKTNNSGQTWNLIDVEINEPSFSKVKFFDEQNGWISSQNSIYKTDDGGNTWKKVFEVKLEN